MHSTTLENLTALPIPIVLDHAAFRSKQYGFRRTVITTIDHNPADGSHKPRQVRVSSHGSITLPSRGKVEGLHPAIVNVPQVRGLLKQGRVRVIKEEASNAPRKARAPKRAPTAPKPSTSTPESESK